MDEWTLNDLLECSVCLERLDTSSKVLPCQHTFCRKCLEEIVSTHKELRCPECRILVDAQINELPPNVLLMRILEGMKNSGNPMPKKKVNSFQRQKGVLITTPEGVPLTSVEGIPIGSLDGVPIPTSQGVQLTADGVPISSLRVPVNSTCNHNESSKVQAAHKLSSVRRKIDLLITTPDGVPITSFEDVSIASPEGLHFNASEGGTITSARGPMNSTCNNVDNSKIQSAQLLSSFRKRKGILITTPEGVPINFDEVPAANPTGVPITSLRGSSNSACNHTENSKIQPTQKQNTLPTQPFAHAIYDYISKEAGDLSFRKGDTILLHRTVDAQWCQGECGGKTGIFPLSYVQVIVPLPNQVATCRALYDFRMANDEDEGCLSFRKDEVITVIRRVDENWAEGMLNDHIGIFPLAFVEMNNVAQALMKLSINSQPGPSRIAPPTPNNDESTPLISSEHTGVVPNSVSLHTSNHNNVSHQNSTNRAAITASVAISGTESGSTISSSTSTPSSSSITPNSSSNTSSSSNSAPNSPPSSQPANNNPNPFLSVSQSPLPMVLQTSHITNSPRGVLPTSHIVGQQSAVGPEPFADTHCIWPPFQAGDIPNFTQHPREKRHSFSAVTPNHHNCSTSNKHSSEVINSESATDTQNGQLSRHGSQRHRRSGSDVNSGAVLPAGYVALYPYKPQKADELELKKGSLYWVTERCQDGWFKGTSYNTKKLGVFPGNYVTLVKPIGTVQGVRYKDTRGSATQGSVPAPIKKTLHEQKAFKLAHVYGQLVPPELPPRASSPSARHQRSSFQNSTISWQPPPSDVPSSQKNVNESPSLSHSGTSTSTSSDGRTGYGSPGVGAASTSTPSKSAEKVKEKKEKSGLIKRLTTKKRSKSPPETASYSMDNPVFDDAPAGSHQVQPHTHAVHLRSGSCPSQLIPVKPEGGSSNHRITSASVSARLKHRERPSVSNVSFSSSTSRPLESNSVAKVVSSVVSSHKKSNSLDAGDARKPRQLVPPVRERFRCIVPYPPNSEYELELKVGDIIYVHRKREDGWYKGTQQRTGRTGLFPASFVETY